MNNEIREMFPTLKTTVYKKQLVYLDNGATTHKPNTVINAVKNFYEKQNSNVHRGVHYLSMQATDKFEESRLAVAKFINSQAKEVVFTKGATESINLVANSFLSLKAKLGDTILISSMEHHANIVPYQQIAKRLNLKIDVIPLNSDGTLNLEEAFKMLAKKPVLLAISHISNVLSVINPVKKLISYAKKNQTAVLIDGCQATAHCKIDVKDLDCDFYVASGHKMFAPTGVGFLYGKYDLLEEMPVYQTGGDVIETVSFQDSTFVKAPYKFEAGTPNIAGVIGLKAAIDFINDITLDEIQSYEAKLTNYLQEKSNANTMLKMYVKKLETPILSFTFGNIHPHDIGSILDSEAIAIRAGHHCAMPLMSVLNVNSLARASLCFYNTFDEIDKLFNALNYVKKVFKC